MIVRREMLLDAPLHVFGYVCLIRVPTQELQKPRSGQMGMGMEWGGQAGSGRVRHMEFQKQNQGLKLEWRIGK